MSDMIECCDGCLKVARKYKLVAGQWLCPDCITNGTPLQRAARQQARRDRS